jgi:hypothetical protein
MTPVIQAARPTARRGAQAFRVHGLGRLPYVANEIVVKKSPSNDPESEWTPDAVTIRNGAYLC